MTIQNATIRGYALAPPNGKPVGGGYRYRNIPGWNPARNPAPRQPRTPTAGHLEKQARLARFTRLRESGTSIPDAARLVGVSRQTGREYEKERLAGRTS